MSDIFNGSCSCGLVKFTLNTAKHSTINCHCRTCRKLNGGAFSTYVAVAQDDFTLREGGDELSRYVVTDNVDKYFCRVCGTPIYNQNKKYPGLMIVPVGALDHPEDFKPTDNIFCESKLPWVPLQDETNDHSQGLPPR